MATRKTTKKSPATKKPAKYERPSFLTPEGITIPCMPLRALLDMLNEAYINPFHKGKDYYCARQDKDIEYDVYQGWLVSKKRIEHEMKFKIDWLLKLPDDYSIAYFGDYFAGEQELPRGLWIGPDRVIRFMHAMHKVAQDRTDDLLRKAFIYDWPDHSAAQMPNEVKFGEFKSEELNDVYWKNTLKNK